MSTAPIAAYKRAIALDPMAADVYGGARRPVPAAESRRRIDHRRRAVAEDRTRPTPKRTGCSARSTPPSRTPIRARRTAGPPTRRTRTPRKPSATSSRRIEKTEGETDPSLRATLARMYVRTSAYDKAIPILRDLVSRERGWQDGVTLLADAYAGAGKNAEAIAWLEEEAPDNPRLYATLGDFYERARRWSDSANAYGIAVERQPRNVDLKIRYGSALLNAGGRENAVKARDALSRRGVVADDRSARVVSPVAGAAARRRSRRGRSDGAAPHLAQQDEPVGLLRARRSAAGPPAVSGHRRCAWHPR